MQMRKIHVIVSDNAPDNAIEKIVETGRITNVNEHRARRFGIVSGDVDINDKDLEIRLKQLSFVESIELDSEKQAVKNDSD